LLASGAAASPAGAWQYSATTDQFTDQRRSRAWSSTRGAVISVRCAEGQVETYLMVQTYIDNDDANVRYRVDKGEVDENVWSSSTTGTGVFSPYAAQTARELASGSRFVIEVTNFADTPYTFSFSLAGSGAAIGRVLNDCGVPLANPRKTDPSIWRRVVDSIDDAPRDLVKSLQRALNLLEEAGLNETGRRDLATYQAASRFYANYWRSCEEGALKGAGYCDRWLSARKYDADADVTGDLFDVLLERLKAANGES
jgi:hypothetical protein